MKVICSKSKNSKTYYIIKSFREGGKCTSRIIERLGSIEEIRERSQGTDPLAWADEYARQLTEAEKDSRRKVVCEYSPAKRVTLGETRHVKGGYLFLEKVYSSLGLPQICGEISGRHQFKYDLNEIMSKTVFSRILHPGSKQATLELTKNFIEKPTFDLSDMYRALSVIAKESDYIQSELFKRSLKAIDRQTDIVYYDCTNYFFEIEKEDDFRKYGCSKENRPNPIVQMGIIMDSTGLPLAYTINPGNTSEQTTLIPLIERLEGEFDLKGLTYCTDNGLAAHQNRLFNDTGGRHFVVTHSLKGSKDFIKEWALDRTGWRVLDRNWQKHEEQIRERRKNGERLRGDEDYDTYDLDSELARDMDESVVFVKERWINEDGLEQRLIVTYDRKYEKYSKALREERIKRAKKKISDRKVNSLSKRQNSPDRYISATHATKDGEAAERHLFTLDKEAIENDEMYDGLYCVATNLERPAEYIIKINGNRWESEYMFRVTKTDMKARPVYLQREDRIKAHFITCFIALMVFRTLQQWVPGGFTTDQLIDTMAGMNFIKEKGVGYIPSYDRTEITDALHDTVGIYTDKQIITTRCMRQILKAAKVPVKMSSRTNVKDG